MGKPVHVLTFQIQRGMNITIQSDIHIGMAKYLAEALCVCPHFHASGRECVAEGMEIGIINPAFFQQCLETVLHRAWFREFIFLSGQQECTWLVCFPHVLQYDFRNGDDANRTAAFRRCYCNLCFLLSTFRLKSLHCLADMDGLLRQ